MTRKPYEIPTLSEMMAERRKAAEDSVKRDREKNTSTIVDAAKARAEEEKRDKIRRKEVAERRKMDIQNLRVDPGIGSMGDNKDVRVNRASGNGHLLVMHKQQPNIWTKPMIDAASRFSRDYDLSHFSGLKATGFDPKVDSSGVKEPSSAVSVVAKMRLEQMQARIGDDYYGILVLVCGMEMTFTEMQKLKLGDKRVLSDMLRTALRKADAFYGGSNTNPRSDFLERAHGLINAIKYEA